MRHSGSLLYPPKGLDLDAQSQILFPEHQVYKLGPLSLAKFGHQMINKKSRFY